MPESRYHSIVISLLLFVTVFLPGCKSSTSTVLENGVAITALSGAADSKKEFKVTLPANTQTLMIQSGANEQIELQLLDSNKNPLSVCYQATSCNVTAPAAGDYYVQLNGLGAYSDLSLVASWGGPDVATLKNAVPVTGLTGKSDTVVLQSLNLPFYFGELTLRATATGNISLELLNSDGSLIETCANPLECKTRQTFSGNYFVRITGQTDFDSLNISASWGGANQATMSNGVPVMLSGTADSIQTESIYIAPGTQALMVQPSNNSLAVFIQILDENGQSELTCNSNCILDNPSSGLHYIQVVYFEYVTNASLVAVWGGENNGFLQNGVALTGLSGKQNDIRLTSVYIPEFTDALMLQTSELPIALQLINSNQQIVWENNSSRPAPINNPPPGLYFVRMRLYEDTTQFSISAAWGGNGQGILQNGVALTGLSGKQNDIRLTSVYIPEFTEALMLQTSELPIALQLINSSQQIVWENNSSRPAPINNPPPGLYFVRMRLYEDTTQFSISAAWGAEDQGSLVNGIPLTLGGNRYNVSLASFYIPENTPAMMLQLSETPERVEILDQHGDVVSTSVSGNNFGFLVRNPIAGVYFIRVIHEYADWPVTLSVAWGANDAGSLINGVPLERLTGGNIDIYVSSIYLSENTSQLTLQTTAPSGVFLELINTDGNTVPLPNTNGSYIANNLPAGLYFVQTHLFENDLAFDLTAVWQ